MTKEVFLKNLSDRLQKLSEEERQRQLSYYDELLSDMIEDGMEEEEAVKKLGNISDIVNEILKDVPMQALIKNRVKPKNGWTGAAVALAVISAPIWLSLLLTAVCLAGSFIITVFALVLSMFAVVLAIGIAGVACFIRGFSLFAMGPGPAIFSIGAGLLLLGLVCLAFIAARYAAAGLFRGARWLYRSLKAAIAKEGK